MNKDNKKRLIAVIKQWLIGLGLILLGVTSFLVAPCDLNPIDVSLKIIAYLAGFASILIGMSLIFTKNIIIKIEK